MICSQARTVDKLGLVPLAVFGSIGSPVVFEVFNLVLAAAFHTGKFSSTAKELPSASTATTRISITPASVGSYVKLVV